MIVITGGAGFIGSALVWQLNQLGQHDILVVDHLGTSDKWKNLVGLRFAEYLDRDVFINQLEAGHFGTSISAILHMGACSATTERNADYLMENNYRYTMRIARWWEKHGKTRLVYASSAATYGDGALGYNDDESKLDALRPLNMYGYSKHLFDLKAHEYGWLDRCVGLKFFNVFGPNEDHKGDMRSVMNKAYPVVRDTGVMQLFSSYHPEYPDGGQKRDFVYVKDVLKVIMFFLSDHTHNGLYNVGTGQSRTWNDVAKGIFAATGKPARIDYIAMPEHLRGKYQYFTEADLAKLRACGYKDPFMSLEDSIQEYITEYLALGKLLGQ